MEISWSEKYFENVINILTQVSDMGETWKTIVRQNSPHSANLHCEESSQCTFDKSAENFLEKKINRQEFSIRRF